MDCQRISVHLSASWLMLNIRYNGGCHCPFCLELQKTKNGHGQKIGQNGHRIGHNVQTENNGQKIGQKGHRISHNVQTGKNGQNTYTTGI